MLKVAAIQMCSSQNVEENLHIAAELVRQAAQQGAILAVLPEMFVLFGEHQDKNKIKEEYGSGLIQNFIAKLAKKIKFGS